MPLASPPDPPTFVALHPGCKQPGCFADGLCPWYPQNQGSAVERLAPRVCFRGFAPGPPDLCRPSSWLQAGRMFCGWAAPMVSAKPGLGGRAAGAAGLFQGLRPRTPATFVALHPGCKQPGCFADGLRPWYPQNQGSAVERLAPRVCFRGFAPGTHDLCRPSSWLQAARMFCGWAAPMVSAKPGLGGRGGCAAGLKSGQPTRQTSVPATRPTAGRRGEHGQSRPGFRRPRAWPPAQALVSLLAGSPVGGSACWRPCAQDR
jgi:hypothetical protein